MRSDTEACSMLLQIIDAAMDSSRYFALRVENPETGSHVFIGIGFAERETAGQFKLTLAEHGRCALHVACWGRKPNTCPNRCFLLYMKLC